MSKRRHTKLESHRLSSSESGWLLSGCHDDQPVSRTRGGGNGRVRHKRATCLPTNFDGIPVEESEESEEEEAWDEAYELEYSDEEDDEYEEFTKPEATRLLVEFDATKKFIENNSRCRDCNGPVEVQAKTICLASTLFMKCNNASCGFVDYSELPAPAKIGETTDERARSTDYAINVLYILSFISSGDGCTEATRLLGLLGLPNDTTMQGRSFNIIEDRISPIMQSVARQILLDNLKNEVKVTFDASEDKDDNDYQLWESSLGDNATTVLTRAKYPEITVSFNMGWQQRSSGRKYASPTGHAFFVGALCRKPVSFCLRSKICN
jgi:hypothetical protein